MPDLNLGMFSVVVLAEFHNPSILAKDYLAGLNVLKPEEVNNFVHTLAVSLVEFGRHRFFVEPGRLEIREQGQDVNIATSRVQDIAIAYVESLPKTPYKATGLNFRATLAFESVETMQNKFSAFLAKDNKALRIGPFSTALCGLRFVSYNDTGKHTVTVEPDYERKSSNSTLNYNFHFETTRPDQVKSVIDRSQELYNDFHAFIIRLLGEV